MTLIDWRELYAANRATIAAAQGRPTGHEPSAGAWERCAYTGAGGCREYFVYTPTSVRPNPELVVLLHGCTQSAASLARSTRMNAAADRHGFVVAYPQQPEAANPQRCWNWFLPAHQARGAGEPAIVAEITREVLARLSPAGPPRRRAFLAGMSAGGAMAAVLGATYPELFAAIGIHSGLAYGVATSQQAAFAALAGRAGDGRALGRQAYLAMGEHARPVPAIVVHGAADRVVAPVNGDLLVEQWLATNQLAAAQDFDGTLGRPAAIVRGRAERGHGFTRAHWVDRHGQPVLEYLRVEGLGHAWSGGAATAAFADPRGPDAGEAMWEFFARVAAAREPAASYAATAVPAALIAPPPMSPPGSRRR